MRRSLYYPHVACLAAQAYGDSLVDCSGIRTKTKYTTTSVGVHHTGQILLTSEGHPLRLAGL
ncbi:uncharacterized protein B0H18DRAFT_1002315, partial [Fomitopsis serialis]|uniref:uncharacterized protein n=1 Tax=Fomitopsis serialis TaxID=139415 RepID=UPI0020073C47